MKLNAIRKQGIDLPKTLCSKSAICILHSEIKRSELIVDNQQNPCELDASSSELEASSCESDPSPELPKQKSNHPFSASDASPAFAGLITNDPDASAKRAECGQNRAMR